MRVNDLIQSTWDQLRSYQKEGIETNIKSDNDQVIIEMKATRAGMEVSGYVQDDTYDEVVKDLKAEGFTCK